MWSSVSFPGRLCSVVVLLSLLTVARSQYRVENCPPVDSTFELVTGWMYSAPQNILETKAGVLQLPDCLSACKNNVSCQALNFETGLCVLFKSQAGDRKGEHVVYSWRVDNQTINWNQAFSPFFLNLPLSVSPPSVCVVEEPLTYRDQIRNQHLGISAWETEPYQNISKYSQRHIQFLSFAYETGCESFELILIVKLTANQSGLIMHKPLG